MKLRILLTACFLALSACSADSIVEKKLGNQYDQALAEGNACLASAIAGEVVRATDTSDNLKPSIFQVSRWEKWGARAEENAKKCVQAYEQAVASGDACAIAKAAGNYGALLQIQFTGYRGNISRDQALQLAELEAKTTESGERCRTGGSNEQPVVAEEQQVAADNPTEVTDGEILNSEALRGFAGDQSSAGVFMDSPILGSEANEDQLEVTDPTNVFRPNDTVYLQVTTRTSVATERTLGVKWTFNHGGEEIPVHEESKRVNLDGSGSTLFNISKPDGWPPGQYTATVQLDGRTRYTAQYTVGDAAQQ